MFNLNRSTSVVVSDGSTGVSSVVTVLSWLSWSTGMLEAWWELFDAEDCTPLPVPKSGPQWKYPACDPKWVSPDVNSTSFERALWHSDKGHFTGYDEHIGERLRADGLLAAWPCREGLYIDRDVHPESRRPNERPSIRRCLHER